MITEFPFIDQFFQLLHISLWPPDAVVTQNDKIRIQNVHHTDQRRGKFLHKIFEYPANLQIFPLFAEGLIIIKFPCSFPHPLQHGSGIQIKFQAPPVSADTFLPLIVNGKMSDFRCVAGTALVLLIADDDPASHTAGEACEKDILIPSANAEQFFRKGCALVIVVAEYRQVITFFQKFCQRNIVDPVKIRWRFDHALNAVQRPDAGNTDPACPVCSKHHLIRQAVDRFHQFLLIFPAPGNFFTP